MVNALSARINHNRISKTLVLILIGLAVLFGLADGIYQVMGERIVGADYYIFWDASRALFMEHQSPYSQSMTERIQMGIHGRLALPDEDPMPFNYPPYGLIPTLALMGIRFSWAQSIWMAFNILVLTAVLLFSLPKAPRVIVLSAPLLYNFAFGILLGNYSVLMSTLLLSAVLWMSGHKDYPRWQQVILGVLLAWCTAKPQFVWAYVLALLLWALYQRMKWLMISFAASMVAFLAFSFIALPTWLSEWIGHLGTYMQYSADRRVLNDIALVFVPKPYALLFGLALIILALLYLGWKVWKIKDLSLGDPRLLAALSLVTYLLLPINLSYMQLILFIPILVWTQQSAASTAVKIAAWGVIWVGSYAAFFLSLSNFYPNAVKVLPFFLFAAWLIAAEALARTRRLQTAL